MDTLSLNSSHPVKTVQRTNLWFDLYDYCIKFSINEAYALRGLSHAKIDKIIQTRRLWGFVRKHNKNNVGSWITQLEPVIITDQDVENLYYLCDFFCLDQRNRRITLTGNNIYVYTNDFSLINNICNLPMINDIEITQVKLDGQPDTVRLKNPVFLHRSYMRAGQLQPSTAKSVKNFLIAQEQIGLSPSLKKWIGSAWNFTMDYYFVDHNDANIVNMSRLIHPRLFRKTVPISSR